VKLPHVRDWLVLEASKVEDDLPKPVRRDPMSGLSTSRLD
jgi:hypothetical protein